MSVGIVSMWIRCFIQQLQEEVYQLKCNGPIMGRPCCDWVLSIIVKEGRMGLAGWCMVLHPLKPDGWDDWEAGPSSHTQWPSLTTGCQWSGIEVGRLLRKPSSLRSADLWGDPRKSWKHGVRVSGLPFCLWQDLCSSWRCSQDPGNAGLRAQQAFAIVHSSVLKLFS